MMNIWDIIYHAGDKGPSGEPFYGAEVLQQVPYARVDIPPPQAPVSLQQVQQLAQPPQPQMAPITEATPTFVNPPQQQAQNPKAEAWKQLLESLKDPKVFQPLMTFIQAATVPLSPGETLGSRLAYSYSLMQMHRQMLEENEQKAPYEERKRQLELEQLEGNVEMGKLNRKAKQLEIDITSEYGMQEAAQKLKALVAENNLKAAELMLKEIEVALRKTHGDAKARAEIELLREQAGMYRRSPRAPGTPGAAQAKIDSPEVQRARQQRLVKRYDTLIGQPWAAAKQQRPELTFEDWLKESGNAVLYRQLWKEVEEHNARSPDYPLDYTTARWTPQGRVQPGGKIILPGGIEVITRGRPEGK